ncbi:MAG: PIN domain-containing protein [Thermoanaerobaculia bacterium]
MDRVFLDANILFSAAYAEGSGLSELWNRKGARLLASGYVIEEARRNLDSEAARKRLEVLLERVEQLGDPAAALDPESEAALPENDRPVLRAAMAAGATHLLSGDRRAFGGWYGKRLAGMLVLRPAEYLKKIGDCPQFQ